MIINKINNNTIIFFLFIFFCITYPNDNVFYKKTIEKDLDNDGKNDKIILTAFGTHPESLKIILNIKSKDKLIYEDLWDSYHYLSYAPNYESLTFEGKKKRVISLLNDFYRDSFSYFDFSSIPKKWKPRTFPDEDPRDLIAYQLNYNCIKNPKDIKIVLDIWNDLLNTNPITFTYSSEEDSMTQIIWSKKLNKFLIIWACC